MSKSTKKANLAGDRNPASSNSKNIITIDPISGVITLDTGTTILRVESPNQRLQNQNDKTLTKKVLIGIATAIPVIGGIMGVVGVLHDLGVFGFTTDSFHSSTPITFHKSDPPRSDVALADQISNIEIKHMSISTEGSVVMTFGDDTVLVVKQVLSLNNGLETLIFAPSLFYRRNTSTEVIHKDMLEYIRKSEKSFDDLIARGSVSTKGDVIDIGKILSVAKGMG